MQLTYIHWKHGRVTRDVQPLRGMRGYYFDRGRVYHVGWFSGDVFNAGRVIDGKPKLVGMLRIGSHGVIEQEPTHTE